MSLSQYLNGSTDILVFGFWFTIAFAIFDIPLIKEGYDMLFNKVEGR